MVADPAIDRVACPHCGEMNALGSNICGACMRDIRHVANPDRDEYEETARKPNPHLHSSWWRKLKRWWISRRRNARFRK